jgi:hypothetical protein
MIITLADWQFQVDVDATLAYTAKCSEDHCTCPYCQNFYENVDRAHPNLRPVLSKFGIYLNGPCEIMPFEPTLVMVCYRVTGQILRKGSTSLWVDDVPLRPEEENDTTFFLWAGEMELPWTQPEDMDEVMSPANQPEFMDRMMKRYLKTRDTLDGA